MNAMSSNTAYFILEWLVNISVILLVLECIVSLLNDIIPFKYFEIYSPRKFIRQDGIFGIYLGICFMVYWFVGW